MFKIHIIKNHKLNTERYFSEIFNSKTIFYSECTEVKINSKTDLVFCDLDNIDKAISCFNNNLIIGVYKNDNEKLNLINKNIYLIISENIDKDELIDLIEKLRFESNYRISDFLKKIITASKNSNSSNQFLDKTKVIIQDIVKTENIEIQLYDKELNKYYYPYTINNKSFKDYFIDKSYTKYRIEESKEFVLLTKTEIEKHYYANSEYQYGFILAAPLLFNRDLIGIIELKYQKKPNNQDILIDFIDSISSILAYYINKEEIQQLIRDCESQIIEIEKFKASFLSNLSHEVRTPLNAIVGFSSLLNDVFSSAEERDEYINIINQNSNVLLQLIEDMVDLAKLESDEIKISKTDINLDLVINESISKLKKAELSMAQLEVDIDYQTKDKSIYVSTDPYRLSQIILVLVKNAVRFGKERQVKIRCQDMKNGSFRIVIQDFGIGISEEQRNKIFDSFNQIYYEHNEAYGGAGIGLSIANSLSKLLNLKLYLKSELNQGSSFYLEFDKTDVKRNQDLKQNLGSYFWENKTILIAEDNESNFLYLNTIIKNSGAKIIWEKDGLSALKRFKKTEKIDLILMDLLMPGMSGFECANEIRKVDNEVIIIAQTAFNNDSYKKRAFHSGCNEFISKPIQASTLLSKLNFYL